MHVNKQLAIDLHTHNMVKPYFKGKTASTKPMYSDDLTLTTHNVS